MGSASADMKGGLAVMLDLAALPAGARRRRDAGASTPARRWAATQSGLAELWAARPELLAGDAAVLGEPTDGPGGGRLPGHDARGRHPRRRAGPHRPPVHRPQRHPPAGPAARAGGPLRAPPGRSSTAASTPSSCRPSTIDGRRGRQRRARRGLGDPQLPLRPRPRRGERPGLRSGRCSTACSTTRRLGRGGRRRPTGRRRRSTTRSWPRWWPVAASARGPRSAGPTWPRFWAHGVPAANFGPGDPLLAHHPDECVTRDSLERARGALGGRARAVRRSPGHRFETGRPRSGGRRRPGPLPVGERRCADAR